MPSLRVLIGRKGQRGGTSVALRDEVVDFEVAVGTGELHHPGHLRAEPDHPEVG